MKPEVLSRTVSHVSTDVPRPPHPESNPRPGQGGRGYRASLI